jgi:hypothetical protein
MAEVKLAFYRSPKQAEALGRVITKSVTLSADEIRTIRNYYVATGEAHGQVYSAFVATMVTLVIKNTSKAFDIAMDVLEGIISKSLFESYYSQLASKFDMLLSSSPAVCTATYTYKRHGSNSGAYWLTDIKLS